MRAKRCGKLRLSIAISSLLLWPLFARGQDAQKLAPPSSPPEEHTLDMRALSESIRQLRTQVQLLTTQLNELRAEQRRTGEEARELRRELRLSPPRQASQASSSYGSWPSSSTAEAPSSLSPGSSVSTPFTQEQTGADRIAKLEEDVQFTDAKINDQYQTKVESGSKYRLRLSGMVLLNMFSNRGIVDNQDFPTLAADASPLDSAGSFGGSFRQSQIGLQVFGPDIGGAHTSAEVNFDFAGGFPDTPNGASFGLVRLRTGAIRLDWANTSLVAGQDHLFFAPLAPTSLASVATPPLAYAGNLWGWLPQVRIEHRVHFSDSSNLVFQGGILDSFSGDLPFSSSYRYPTWGEESGQPAYAARIAWTRRIFGQDLTAGFGGYYGRQYWGFGRNVDGWAGTTDLTLPLGKLFEFTGEFYRGRALGGIGGGIDQTVLQTGSLMDPATAVRGLNSMGGWTQLKVKPKPKFEINGAFGQDNPFASQINLFPQNSSFYDSLVERNRSAFGNFIYQPRSDVLFSVEYRRIRTFYFGGEAHAASHVNASLGYVF